MKKALAGLAVGGLLTLGAVPMTAALAAYQAQAPVQAAQVRPQQTDPTTTTSDDGDSGKWGLLGLLGLLGLGGLAGLKRRDRYDDRRQYATAGTGTTPTRTP